MIYSISLCRANASDLCESRDINASDLCESRGINASDLCESRGINASDLCESRDINASDLCESRGINASDLCESRDINASDLCESRDINASDLCESKGANSLRADRIHPEGSVSGPPTTIRFTPQKVHQSTLITNLTSGKGAFTLASPKWKICEQKEPSHAPPHKRGLRAINRCLCFKPH